MPKIDETGESVRVSKDDLVRVDGITICRRVVRDGVLYLQFYDRDKIRSNCRGSNCVEVPFSVLSKFIVPAGMSGVESYDA